MILGIDIEQFKMLIIFVGLGLFILLLLFIGKFPRTFFALAFIGAGIVAIVNAGPK